MNTNRKTLLLLFIILSLTLTAAAAAAPVRVLILPFDINAEEDLSFLKKGIQDMLSTRLSDPEKVTVVDRETVRQAIAKAPGPYDRSAAVNLAGELNADYVIFGSLTVFGESISTDARFVETATQKESVTFHEFGKGKGDVIDHVNRFAGQINEAVFGQKTPAAAARQAPREETVPESRRNPEEVWKREQRMQMGVDDGELAGGEKLATLWKTRRFNADIKGVGIDDVDGDGNLETAFISDHHLYVYRYMQGRFEKVAEFEDTSKYRHIALDIADVNGNGTPEVFLTGVNDLYRPRVLVLEWNGGKFDRVAEETGWFFRVIRVPGERGKMLLGQQGGIDTVFSGGIYEMIWSGGSYSPEAKQPAPGWGNVFGIAYGDILNNGTEAVAAISKDERLNLLHLSGEKEWTSPDPYGGSYSYLVSPAEKKETQRETHRGTDPMPRNRTYLPPRVHVADMDGDGNNEIVLVRNFDVSGRVLKRVRVFRSGHFEFLSWDNVGLRPKWKTRKFSGYISDYTLGDIDNDGKDELVFSVVTSTGPIVGKQRSYIVSWDANN